MTVLETLGALLTPAALVAEAACIVAGYFAWRIYDLAPWAAHSEERRDRRVYRYLPSADPEVQPVQLKFREAEAQGAGRLSNVA